MINSPTTQLYFYLFFQHFKIKRNRKHTNQMTKSTSESKGLLLLLWQAGWCKRRRWNSSSLSPPHSRSEWALFMVQEASLREVIWSKFVAFLVIGQIWSSFFWLKWIHAFYQWKDGKLHLIFFMKYFEYIHSKLY